MNPQDKYLSYALDSLTVLAEDMRSKKDTLDSVTYTEWRQHVSDVKFCIEQAAAIPKPSIIRRLFTRKDVAA